MYLSRVTINPVMYRRYIQDDYSVHKLVYDLFLATNSERFLYVDKGMNRGIYTLLVLSPQPPREQTDFPVETREVPERFWNHTHYAFEIVLNPVRRSRQVEGSRRKKLEPIVAPKALREWFVEKAGKAGFEPDQERLQILVLHPQQFSQKFQEPSRKVTQNKVQFSGILTVTDPQAFLQACTHGIGRGKGFGFGLLQLTPVF